MMNVIWVVKFLIITVTLTSAFYTNKHNIGRNVGFKLKSIRLIKSDSCHLLKAVKAELEIHGHTFGKLSLPPCFIKSLHSHDIYTPTIIQSRSFPAIDRGESVIIQGETGNFDVSSILICIFVFALIFLFSTNRWWENICLSSSHVKKNPQRNKSR